MSADLAERGSGPTTLLFSSLFQGTVRGSLYQQKPSNFETSRPNKTHDHLVPLSMGFLLGLDCFPPSCASQIFGAKHLSYIKKCLQKKPTEIKPFNRKCFIHPVPNKTIQSHNPPLFPPLNFHGGLASCRKVY